MNRVLVTGAAGFVGKHCLAALSERGFEVHAVSRTPRHSSDVEWHQANLLDPEQARAVVGASRPDSLLHLAWYVVPGEYWASTDNLPWVTASLNLVKLFAGSGGRRALLLGTGAEYDPRFGHCIEGRTPIAPSTMYGAAKASVGMLLAPVAAAYGIESSAWARLFYVYGPGEHPARLVPSTIRALLQNKRAGCNNATHVRDPLVIEDAADALVTLLESNVTGPVNIGSGEGVAVHSLVSCIGRLLDRESLLDIGALRSPPGEADAQVADVARLATELGWRPRFTLEQGVEHTIAWWREELAAVA